MTKEVGSPEEVQEETQALDKSDTPYKSEQENAADLPKLKLTSYDREYYNKNKATILMRRWLRRRK